MSEEYQPKKKFLRSRKKGVTSKETYGTLGVFWSLGWRVAIEWGAAVAVGGFLGSLLDEFFHFEPVWLIVGLLLGSAAGIVNIYAGFPLPRSRPKV